MPAPPPAAGAPSASGAPPLWPAQALAGSAAAVWSLDLATARLQQSPGMRALAGCGAAAGAGGSTAGAAGGAGVADEGADDLAAAWTTRVAPADRARVRAWMLVAEQTGRGGQERFVLRGDDGVEREVHAWVEVALGPDGRAAHLYGSALDVTGAAREPARDPLTQLPGRAAVLDRLAGAPGAVLVLLDLDRFAVLDDALGRTRSDALLAATAVRLRAAAPAGALVARLEGDRFAVVTDPTSGPGAGAAPAAPGPLALASALVDHLRAPHAPDPAHPGAGAVVVTASAGTATADPADPAADDPEEVVRRARLALRRAKAAGRDTARAWVPALGEAAAARLRSEAVLRAALDAGRLGVLYQPAVDLRTGAVAGVEALGRIVDPELGPLSPALFVDVAEETGLVVRLDEWVLGRASAMAQRWRPPQPDAVLALPPTSPAHPAGAAAPERLPTVAVNMSSRTLARPDLAALVAGALRLSGSQPSRLLVEITEHSLLDAGVPGEPGAPAGASGAGGARATLDGLVELGVGVGIDDFGTGWSALSYLSALDLAFMKVDRCFVARLGTDASADAVVRAVVDLAHAHDLVVIAEGVETEAQARALAAMGCDHGQGWWFGRPQAEADLDAAVLAWYDRAREAGFGAWAPPAAAGPAAASDGTATAAPPRPRAPLAAAGAALSAARGRPATPAGAPAPTR